MKQRLRKFRPVIVASLLALTLNSAPASASHNNHGYVAPLAAFVAFSLLTQRSSHHHRHNHNYNQRHQYQGHKRRHSQSSGRSHKRHSYSH
jgi:hypothetical protein